MKIFGTRLILLAIVALGLLTHPPRRHHGISFLGDAKGYGREPMLAR
jgi:hypothetical protein